VWAPPRGGRGPPPATHTMGLARGLILQAAVTVAIATAVLPPSSFGNGGSSGGGEPPPAAAAACPPNSCGALECVPCCHKGRCCKKLPGWPWPCPRPTPPGHLPRSQCLLPKANDGRCCKPGTKDRGFNRPCDDSAFAAAHAFCNTTLGWRARIDDIIGRMSRAEKIDNLNSASVRA
jgi:hypothetical protein